MKRTVKVNQESISRMLPDIPRDFDADMRRLIACLPDERKEPVMRKKLSVSLVLAIVLVLIVIGALAALLTGKSFVDQVAAPLAKESAEMMFTRGELDEILKQLDAAHIVLDKDLRTRLETTQEGYYKEELMRAIAKTELGFYPSRWSIADQYWYGELLVESGQLAENSHILPQEGELTQDEAFAAAVAYIHASYDPTAEVADPALFDLDLQYLVLYDHPDLPPGQRCWYIEYSPRDLHHDYYFVCLSPQGEVLETYIQQGLTRDWVTIMRDYELDWAYERVYGRLGEREPEVMIQFREDLKKIYDLKGVQERAFAAIISQTYGIPDARSISKEDAIQIARTALNADEKRNPFSSLYMLGNEGPIWKIAFFMEDTRYRSAAEISAYTGQVLRTQVIDSENPKLNSPYCLVETTPVNIKPIDTNAWGRTNDDVLWHTDPATPLLPLNDGGMPYYWRTLDIPDAYWEHFEAMGITGANIQEKTAEWTQSYGKYLMDWPLEEKALYALFHEDPSNGSLHGLPMEGDITPDEAIQIARDAAKVEGVGILTGEEIDALKPDVTLLYNQLENGHRMYYIGLWEMTRTPCNEYGSVTIDAQTGEVLSIFVSTMSNG